MKLFRRLGSVLLAVLLLAALLGTGVLAQGSEVPHSTTILFTHDLHSHFLPQSDGAGGESGGYARLATALADQRVQHPDALTLDGGDFSVGSLIQTLYTAQAPELRTMGLLGYDATTAGNHEFDHTGIGFSKMLQAAYTSGDRLPALLMSNYAPAEENPDQLDIQRAMSAYGVRPTLLLERGGVTYGIFGLMGTDLDECVPNAGFVLEDPETAAQRCVDSLKEQGAQFIIALSHSGTEEKTKKSEDETLAQKVTGIDVILSGRSHTTLDAPIVVGDTYIVSAGPYCENLGSITLSWSEDGTKTLTDYRLIPIDGALAEQPEVAALVEEWKSQVGVHYLARYNMTHDQVLAHSAVPLETPKSGIQEGNALGELVADAFRWAVQQAEGADHVPVAAAVTADGVLRAKLAAGPITVSQAFDVLSMGVGADGTSGFPLVSVYLTGRELKALAEVDASVTPIMPATQLYVSGLEYQFNTHRMPFNRVTRISLVNGDGSRSKLADGQLYRVVSGMYSAQMLGAVKDKSMGLLSIQPKDAQGNLITDYTASIIRDHSGSEVKEWYALGSYLTSFPQKNGVAQLSDQYAQPDGRKQVSHSWNPIELLRSPNWVTIVTLLVLILVVALAVFLVRGLVSRIRGRRYGGRKGRYRG